MTVRRIKGFLLFLIFILLIAGIPLCLLSHALLPWSYILISLSAGITLIIILFYFDAKSPYIYICIILLTLLLRNLYNIVTNFKVIPLYDAYSNLAIVKIFEENGRAFIIQPYAGFLAEPIRDTSIFPLAFILEIIFSSITSINIPQTFLLTPLIFSLLMLSFIALLLKRIAKKLGITEKVVFLSVLIFAVSPDGIYDGLVFYTRFYAYVFFYMSVFLLYTSHVSGKRDSRKAMLLILSCIAMVLSHSLTPFVFALFLLFMYLSTSMGKRLFKRFLKSTIQLPSISIISFAFVCFFAWQLFYSPEYVERLIRYSWNFFLTYFLGKFKLGSVWEFERLYFVHKSLRPEPAIFILYLRDIAIFAPAVIGFIMFVLPFLKKKVNRSSQFLLFSVSSLAMIFVVLNILNLKPLTMLSYALAFITIFAAVFYIRILSGKIRLFKFVSVTMIVLMVFTAFLSPWSHTHFQLYIYDPSVRFEDVGVHNPLSLNLESFINNYTLKDKLFLSDDPQLLYAIMQRKDYASIRSLDDYDYELFGKKNTYIIELVHLNPHGYYLLNSTKLEEIKFRLPIEYNVILDAQHYRIFFKK